MMTDYISRDSAIKSIKALKGYTKQGKDKGEWISTERSILGEMMMECNNCGVRFIETKSGMTVPMLKIFDYCPMCGADMRTTSKNK